MEGRFPFLEKYSEQAWNHSIPGPFALGKVENGIYNTSLWDSCKEKRIFVEPSIIV